MRNLPSLAETYEQILREREPNFLRLYLNPHVAQTCFCLDRYVRTTWPEPLAKVGRGHLGAGEDWQSFLANGLEEALSGAIKLARYSQHIGPRSTGLVFDPADRLAGFAGAELAEGGRVELLPRIRVLGKDDLSRESGAVNLLSSTNDREVGVRPAIINPLVLVAGANELLETHAKTIRLLARRDKPLVITCIDRESLAGLRSGSGGILREIAPDIVIFDESFVDHAVPFGAFTARKSLFACWNRPSKATFHSTTFQPNTISTLHFMNSLVKADPEFYGRHSQELQGPLTELSRRGEWFRRYYSPALYRLIRATGFNTLDVRAFGSFVIADGRPIFDAVSGVACSFRGHNPTSYADELNSIALELSPCRGADPARSSSVASGCEAELRHRLESLTGLAHFLPAVSGASAVENALKVALVAQFPKRHILALKAGYGGKTLLALAGTANPAYKENLDPLYADVHYVNPFASDAQGQIDALMQKHEIAVVHVELIQGVGGVRRVPETVIRHLDEGRKRWGYLLLVDEVQTGMHRTGPFILSRAVHLSPDLLLLGKATSDMMFPLALTLYSATVQAMLERNGSDLADVIKRRYGYAHGYETVINVLRMAGERDISRQVAEAGAQFANLLRAGFGQSKAVRDVRVFGLLIGIELDADRWPGRWLRKRLSTLYLLNMLRHPKFPVFAGICQYEPNVLKITPPLNVSPDEIRQACGTIVDVLNRPMHKVVAATLRALINRPSVVRTHHEHANDSALEPAAR